jgi:hypothetical protein
MHTSPLIPKVTPTCLTMCAQRCICHKNVFTFCGSCHKTLLGLYSPWYAVVTHRTTDCTLYHMIGTVLKQPHLEETGPRFTLPDERILTSLPWRRCVIIKSKLQKVNPCEYYTHTTLILAVTSHP